MKSLDIIFSEDLKKKLAEGVIKSEMQFSKNVVSVFMWWKHLNGRSPIREIIQ